MKLQRCLERCNESFHAVQETIRIYEDEKVIKEYLESRVSEVVDIMMLSNCTKPRTFRENVYGDCFSFFCPKMKIFTKKLKNRYFFNMGQNSGHASQAFRRKIQKRLYYQNDNQQRIAYVLPALGAHASGNGG